MNRIVGKPKKQGEVITYAQMKCSFTVVYVFSRTLHMYACCCQKLERQRLISGNGIFRFFLVKKLFFPFFL